MFTFCVVLFKAAELLTVSGLNVRSSGERKGDGIGVRGEEGGKEREKRVGEKEVTWRVGKKDRNWGLRIKAMRDSECVSQRVRKSHLPLTSTTNQH